VGADRDRLEERLDAWTVRHPNAPVLRVPLRLPIVLWRLGLGPLVARFGVRRGYLVVLTVTGRSSGVPRHTPVVPHVVGGQTYVWCPYGGRSQWYRNVIADPVVTVQSRRGTQVMRAVGIEDVDEANEVVSELRRFDAAFLRSYLAAEGIADTPEDIARNKQRLHIRRLEPVQEEGPPVLEADLVWLWLVPVALAAWIVRRRRRRSPATRGILRRSARSVVQPGPRSS
jgi:deazaflavin-dependent oxidoreductase (nitroreductase family)